MSIETYRNESMVRMETYNTDPARADALVGQVRAKWALLRDTGYAGDYRVEVLRSGRTDEGRVKIVEIFRWKSGQAEIDGKNSPEYRRVVSDINSLVSETSTQDSFTQVVRG